MVYKHNEKEKLGDNSALLCILLSRVTLARGATLSVGGRISPFLTPSHLGKRERCRQRHRDKRETMPTRE